MTSRLDGLIVDSRDPRKLAEFWCAALGYIVYADNGDGIVEIGPDPEVADRDRLDRLREGPDVPAIAFVEVPEPKSGKNRLHFDIAPIDSDQDTELARLIGLGAKKADVGAGTGRSWIVLADPEGNEFCLVRSLAPGLFTLPGN
ncbi:MAG TPA: VOC family protein [Pseudonocardiaceae bacterium]